MNMRDGLLRKARRSGSENDWSTYKGKRNQVNNCVKAISLFPFYESISGLISGYGNSYCSLVITTGKCQREQKLQIRTCSGRVVSRPAYFKDYVSLIN
jgi:hypothetical protein